MTGKRYTENETVLCAYAAIYDAEDFGGSNVISILTGRKMLSISTKIRNIAATLDKYGIPRNMSLSALSGTPSGEPARDTDWDDIIEPLTHLSHEALLDRCRTILKS